jgi:short-subunit dehydrogenase
MSNSIVIAGAGPGLGQAVAHRYAREGYDVVLVARGRERLDALAAQLSQYGRRITTVTADLAQDRPPLELISAVREAVGAPTALYYASNPGTPNAGLQPATTLTAEPVRAYMPHAVYSLIALVQEFLPDMLERNEGEILVALGVAALAGHAIMSGPGLALAAQRNYLQSLQAEVEPRGVFVGRLYIGAAIVGTPFHANLLAAKKSGAPVPDFPIVEPETLVDLLRSMRSERRNEVVYPQQPST